MSGSVMVIFKCGSFFSIPKHGSKTSSLTGAALDVGIDLALLPPSKRALQMHIKRANFQAHIWRLSNQPIPDIPSPVGRGWEKNSENKIICKWFEGECMPTDLADLVNDDVVLDNDEIHEENEYDAGYDGEDSYYNVSEDEDGEDDEDDEDNENE